MADTYDVIICGSGSGGGFLAGQIAQNASVLIIEAGPYPAGAVNPGVGSPARRTLSTQMNLGTYIPNSAASNRGAVSWSYPMYMDQSQPSTVTVQREARIVGGGSFINVGAWLRPRLVDWDGFHDETGVTDWTKPLFEPHFQRAERILSVHRDLRQYWNKSSLAYEQAAIKLGIPVFETASNRLNCIRCGHRLDAGMPCKYDSLMGTAMTQIPKAMASGAKLVSDASVQQVIVQNGTATGVIYRDSTGALVTANARKLVVISAGCYGSPLILRNSGVFDLNPNVGNYLRSHPGAPMDVLLPGDDWNQDRGYQWNMHHYVMDQYGDPMDACVHAGAGFMATTPWVAASFRIPLFGAPYKDAMRAWPSRAGAFIFTWKPAVYGRVVGTVDNPVISYPVIGKDGLLEPKTLNDLISGIKQVGKVYESLGAYAMFPNPNDPISVLAQQVSLFVSISGALHGQGTCRAGVKQSNSVVDTNCMSWDVKNLMVCDASVIPNHISANPNALIMAIASRAGDFVNSQILGVKSSPTAYDEMLAVQAALAAQAQQEAAADAAAAGVN